MGSSPLLSLLASLPPDDRDRVVEEHLGIADGAPHEPPGEHLVGYHPSGIASIVRAFLEMQLGPADVLVDVGAGLGKVALLANLLTGARARGIELQPDLVARARGCASKLGLDVPFSLEDARGADLSDGTVFFLYAPFTGPALEAVVDRLGATAEHHEIVIATLGIDLPPRPWLRRRELDAFWLALYEAKGPGAAPRVAQPSLARSETAEIVAHARPLAYEKH